VKPGDDGSYAVNTPVSGGHNSGVAGPWVPSDSGLPGAAEQHEYYARPFSAPRPRDVEDCVACRFIWLQIEQDVGNSQIEENIYDAFSNNCKEAQVAPIFYPACNDMWDQIDDMIGDYMDGYSVNQLCENSRLCRG